MKAVFADTSYWIAVVDPRDELSERAEMVRDRLGEEVHLVTTDEVLIEVLNYFSGYGPVVREQVAAMVRNDPGRAECGRSRAVTRILSPGDVFVRAPPGQVPQPH